MKLKFFDNVMPKDIQHIFARPWEATQNDIDTFCLDRMTVRELENLIIGNYAQYYGYTIMDGDGVPVAIFGAQKQLGEPNVWWTWFFASDAFPKHWRNITDLVRRTIEKDCKTEGVKELRAYSPASSRAARIWFANLGFQKSQDVVIHDGSGQNLFVYKRKFQVGV